MDHFLESHGILASLDQMMIDSKQRERLKVELRRAVMALTHLNKFSNNLFKDYRSEIETIRNVTQQYNQSSYQNFIRNDRFCLLFLLVFQSKPCNEDVPSRSQESYQINPAILESINNKLQLKDQWMFLGDEGKEERCSPMGAK